MTQPMEGGRRRIDRVLAPGYLDHLAERPLDEVRVLRRDAEQEESDLSYVRRLLQGRLDILRAEVSRRAGGGQEESEADFVTRLARTLTDSGPRSDQSHARVPHIDPSRVGEHRRRVEQIVADVGFSDLDALSDDELSGAISRLGAFEDEVSQSRRKVQEVVDACTAEIGRRYKDGAASVEDLLTGR
ncbi:RsiG family protein [Motilibacter aurantiacus]|uniref:RsiG family protein n=1 Tax=Motilibacter aurantiacus TaxID=2714955 RepID=UPI00140A9DB3|nr:aerial mycelium formation protein [Motilibacter aurantiacus]NHC46850.1 aerial mycelium formation protein [Motilibacter aurantiacus]